MSVHGIAASSLTAVAARLRDLRPAFGPGDLLLIHPDGGALRCGDDNDVHAAYEPFGGAICVAAGSEPVGAVDASVWPVLGYRRFPVPLGMCGPAEAMAALVETIAKRADAGEDEVAAFIEVAGSGEFDIALDLGAQVFAVLDGTGTDFVAIAGRLHAGGERPCVAIDTTGGARLAPVAAALRAPTSGDLAALLRYEAASASPPVATMVASDIVAMPLWSAEFCAVVIRAAEAAGIWAADPDDPVPGAEVSLLSISPRLVALLDADWRARVWPELQRFWSDVAITEISDAFVIRYEPGGDQAELPLHHDVAQVSGAIKLNAGYDGGALEFPRQGWSTAEVPRGTLVAWPSLVTHPHRSSPVTRGVKYSLTIWTALPD